MFNSGLTLRSLISQLDKLNEPDEKVYFDFGRMYPTEINSYRGYYEDLAIGYTEDYRKNEPQSVAEFLNQLNACLGRSFQGYKGGTYVAGEDSAIWVANWGDTTDTIITEVKVAYSGIFLLTANEEV